MFSSGTTGEPKGIVVAQSTRAMYGFGMARDFRITDKSVILHSGSLVFNGCMLSFMPTFCVGGTYILLDKFEPKQVLEILEAESVSHTVCVPTQIVSLLAHESFKPERLTSLEALISVGSPLLSKTRRQVISMLPKRLHELYGLTEGICTVLDKEDAEKKVKSVGRATAGNEIKIVDDIGVEVSPMEVGEIAGKGIYLSMGYHGREDLTLATMRGGWLLTGDLGYLDEDGFLYLVDRKKDMLIVGGVNVFPKDIEEVVSLHESISEVAVFGVPDEKWGEIPIAMVVLTAGKDSLDPGELKPWINARVGAKYQRIHGVWVMGAAEVPRNIAGKVLKRQLRDDYPKSMARQSNSNRSNPVKSRL